MRVLGIVFVLLPVSALAQQPEPSPPHAQPQPPQFEETVEVVGVTPIHGLGLSKYKVPSNVQVFTAPRAPDAPDVTAVLATRAASVHVNEVQAGSFQPDLVFRGFSGSPLLGASEGLAVYQDGVRLNEAFGDTLNWAVVPSFAIASINLMPGSNPLFGLNALGGALSIRTKNGFDFPTRRAAFTTGSFARHHVHAEAGGHGSSLAYFVAGSLVDENGWRDFSPSTTRRVFGDLAWRGTASTLSASVTVASNDLTGNGPAPRGLLEQDRGAVFTHPDRTDHDSTLFSLTGQRRLSPAAWLDGVAYMRRTSIETFNGDAADHDDDHAAGDTGPGFDAVNNVSETRSHAAGVSGQITRTAPLLGKDNHFIAGGSIDTTSSRFGFATELARLTIDRGTVGAGVYDDDAFVNLRSRSTTLSALVANTWSPGGAWSISGSARVNWTGVTLRDQIGTALTGDHRFWRINPAVGVTYQARPTVNLYGSYTQSSRVPTPVELTCADPEDPCRLPNAFVSDPPLDQVVAGTFEAGARGTTRGLAWTVAGFATSVTDDVIFVSSGRLRGQGHFENVDRTRRLGVESSLEYSPRANLTVFGAYTMQRATFGTNLRVASRFHPLAGGHEILVERGDRLPNVPTHLAKAGVAIGLGAGVNVGVDLRAQSGQYLRGDEANLLPRVPGFAVAEVRAAKRLTSRLTAVARVQNLLGLDHYTFGVLGDAALLGDDIDDAPEFYTPGSPRAAWAGLEVRF